LAVDGLVWQSGGRADPPPADTRRASGGDRIV
jgi:hypothetical protein